MSGLVPYVEAPTPICGLMEARCRCVLPPAHDGPHECDPVECGGSWVFAEDGGFRIVKMAGSALPAERMAPAYSALGFLFGDDW